jgi:hypothetical protein
MDIVSFLSTFSTPKCSAGTPPPIRLLRKAPKAYSFDLGADPALIEPFQYLKGLLDNWQASLAAGMPLTAIPIVGP